MIKEPCKYNYTQLKSNYMTPPEVYKPLLKEIGAAKFDLDVCCTIKNIPAKKHYINGKSDGLKKPWAKINWMNPPFKYCELWVEKAFNEQQKGNTTYSILPARTESVYWKNFILNNPNCEIRYIPKTKKDGVTFIDPDTLDYVKIEVKNKKTKKTKLVNGLYKNPLAIVIFHGVKAVKNG